MVDYNMRIFFEFDGEMVLVWKKNSKENSESLKGCWETTFLKFSPSPYLVTKDILVVEDPNS